MRAQVEFMPLQCIFIKNKKDDEKTYVDNDSTHISELIQLTFYSMKYARKYTKGDSALSWGANLHSLFQNC